MEGRSFGDRSDVVVEELAASAVDGSGTGPSEPCWPNAVVEALLGAISRVIDSSENSLKYTAKSRVRAPPTA